MGLDKESKIEGLILANKLRQAGFNIDMDYNSCTMKSQFKLAERVNAKYIIIIGEEERQTGVYTVRNTVIKEQEKIKKENIINYLRG